MNITYLNILLIFRCSYKDLFLIMRTLLEMLKDVITNLEGHCTL